MSLIGGSRLPSDAANVWRQAVRMLQAHRDEISFVPAQEEQ
jgi:hypothetical protein